MVDFHPLHQVIHERMTNPNANYYEIPWWEAEIKQFTANIQESIQFIENECSDEEFYWLAEVFDDIMEKTRSVDFLNCIRRRVQMVKDDGRKAELLEDIKTAEEYVDEPPKE